MTSDFWTESIFSLPVIAAGTYVVFTPILQEIALRMRSKYPQTTATTKQFLVQTKDKDILAVPSLWHLPFRILANASTGLTLIPSIIFFGFTVGIPFYALEHLVDLLPQQHHYSLAILAIFLINYQLYKQWKAPSFEPGDDLPPNVQKKVAIIGGGCSGLCVAKEMAAEGHHPVIFEKTSGIGGLWQRGEDASKRTALVLEETYTSSSALNTAFSDFPIQPEMGGNETFCMSQKGFMKYVDSFADNFGLKKYVQNNTEVVSVQRNAENSKWEVTVVRDKEQTTHEFDMVAVCSGQANIPNTPRIKGQDQFKGNIRHSTELRDPEQIKNIYKGKKVLCIGYGETASDNAHLVAQEAVQCDLSIRDAVLVLNRNLLGAHADYEEHRTMLSCPPFVRWSVYKMFILFCIPFTWAYVKVWGNKTYHVPSFLLQWRVLFTRRYLYECLTGKRSIFASVQITKTENFLYIINGTTSKIMPDVCHINADGKVVFKNGTIGDYDEILCNTGFQPHKFPFLPHGFNDGVSHTREDRYLAMFHPQLPDMAFIGFARGQVGSLVLGFELQARWFALLASAKRKLPSLCEMKRVIAEERLTKECKHYSRASWFYANYLARYHVKCEPNVLQFFWEHPVACLKAYMGAPTGYLYRMRGPHANPKAALQGYALSTCAVFYLPPTWFLHHPLWFVSGVACDRFWSRLPLVGPYFRPSLDRYH